MTRKRKNVESTNTQNTNTARSAEQELKEGQNGNCEEQRAKWESHGKRYRGERPRKTYGDDDFSREYGYVGGGNQVDVLENMLDDSQKGKGSFPTEIVTYLRNIDRLLESEGKLEDFVLEKCISECSGEEATLLSFKESCIVVESVFGSSPCGAQLFLSALCRLKHRDLTDLMFTGCSSRTIEKLIYAMAPIKNSVQTELLNKIVGLLCDNWKDAVCNQYAAFLIRCLTRVLCGLPPKEAKFDTNSNTFLLADKKVELLQLFDRIVALSLDFKVTGGFFENPHCSLVVQDVIEADKVVNAGNSSIFVKNALENAETSGQHIIGGWCGKNSSRIWEKVVASCTEESRSSLWEVVRSGISDIAFHPSANFPLQRLISSIKSFELAREVYHEIKPLIRQLLSANRPGVVVALIRCLGSLRDCGVNEELDLQEHIIKELRHHFRANKASTRTDFFINVITFNAYDGIYFDVEKCHLQGGLIIEALFSFTKLKTLSTCLEALPPQDVLRLAKNRCGSHVLQAAFESRNLANNIKLKLIDAFEGHWEELISDIYGSHVFESLWDCSLFDVRRQQELLKKLLPIHNPSKFWRFAMLRCDLNLFRKSRKEWVMKMKLKEK